MIFDVDDFNVKKLPKMMLFKDSYVGVLQGSASVENLLDTMSVARFLISCDQTIVRCIYFLAQVTNRLTSLHMGDS